MATGVFSEDIVIPALGGTVNVDVESIAGVYNIVPEANPLTLLANLSLSPDGTAEKDMTITFLSNGSIIKGAYTYSIFGFELSATQALYPFQINCYYNGTDWDVYFTLSDTVPSNINGSQIVANTIPLNRLTGMTSAQILQANNTNTPTATTVTGDVTLTNAGVTAIGAKKVLEANLQDSTPTYALIVDGSNRPKFQQITGDITLSNTAVATIQPGVITPAMLSFTTGLYIVTTVNLSSAQILLLNSNPVLLIPSPGAGASIVVHKALLTQTFVTTAYATNTTPNVYTDTATQAQATSAGDLDFTVSRIINMNIGTGAAAATDTLIIPNKGLYISVSGGNPTAGDGTMSVTVFYTLM